MNRRASKKPQPLSAGVRNRMRSVRRENTGAESALRALLHGMGLRYRLHVRVFADEKIKPDIVFRPARVAVYVDGCFWHACPLHASWPKHNAAWWREKIARNVARDAAANRILQQRGWRVIRIWEHEKPAAAAKKIARIVNKARGR